MEAENKVSSMTSQERSRNEYISRINQVMDYMEKHLDQPIRLDVLSEVAHFSPFHFHRIFTLIVGETPSDFMLRLRIEKAAQAIKDDSSRTISEIAYDGGFSSVSLFSRCFRKHFGMTAKDFRSTEKPVMVKGGIYYSKNGQVIGKNGQLYPETESQLCSIKLKQFIIMDTKVTVKDMPEMNVIYCRHKGAFNQIHEAYGKLMRWAGPRGLLNSPDAQTMTVYHDDPAVTEIEKVRQSACLVVKSDVKVEGEIGKMTVPAGKYAVGHFEIDVTQFEQAWNTVCLWFTESGYEPGSGYSYELYYNNHEDHPEKKFILDICIPVKTL
jgi:AraC family transcriptional regulator